MKLNWTGLKKTKPHLKNPLKWNYLPKHIEVWVWSLPPKGNHSKLVSLQCGCTFTDLFSPCYGRIPPSQGAPWVLAQLAANKWGAPKHSSGTPVPSPGFLPGLCLMPLFVFWLLKMCISCSFCSFGRKERSFLQLQNEKYVPNLRRQKFNGCTFQADLEVEWFQLKIDSSEYQTEEKRNKIRKKFANC